MMIQKPLVLILGLALCLAAISGGAQTTNVPGQVKPPGKLGDPAPPLTVLAWAKGQPVKIAPGTNVYVLVFCTLSRANEFALTNLTDLQKLYRDKGVVVVAISDDPPQTLTDFVRAKGGDIDFTVAADDFGHRTTTAYQIAFQQSLMPRGYVVGRDGTVLWFGHPLREGMGEVVDEIVSGKYNLAQMQKTVVAQEQMDAYLMLARQGDERSGLAGRMMLAVRTNDAPALCDLAFKIATDPLIQKRDYDVANAALDRAAQLAVTNATDVAVTRAILLFQSGKRQAGLVQAKQALTIARTDDEKGEVNATIKAMETRQAMDEATSKNSSTNAPQP